MNRIENENHFIGTFEVNKVSCLCLDDKIYILNNGYDELALAYQK